MGAQPAFFAVSGKFSLSCTAKSRCARMQKKKEEVGELNMYRTHLDQNRAPIYEALETFRRMRVVPFDVPGHKH